MFKTLPQDDLVVLELANNHMGDVEHGLEVIRHFGSVCRNYPEFKFAFKLQYGACSPHAASLIRCRRGNMVW
jgi:hypothetical protein